MNTILVPLSGSILAEQVLPYVRVFAALLEARVQLLRVVEDSPGSDTLAESIATIYGVDEPFAAQQAYRARSLELLRHNAERSLEPHAALLRDAGLPVTGDVRCGRAAESIVVAALEQHVALIALAAHAYSGLKGWSLGRVADTVVHATSTPVLIVRGTAPAHGPAIKRILVPLDGSALAEQALPLAIDLARRARAELILLRAVMPNIEVFPTFRIPSQRHLLFGEVLESLHHQADKDLDALADQLHSRGLIVKTEVVNGHAAEVLVDVATQYKVDLIVMATHGYSGLRRWAVGGVADKVLHHTTTPLILVHGRS